MPKKLAVKKKSTGKPTAEAGHRRKASKAQAIRDTAQGLGPGATAREIVAALAADDVKVSVAQVNRTLKATVAGKPSVRQRAAAAAGQKASGVASPVYVLVARHLRAARRSIHRFGASLNTRQWVRRLTEGCGLERLRHR